MATQTKQKNALIINRVFLVDESVLGSDMARFVIVFLTCKIF